MKQQALSFIIVSVRILAGLSGAVLVYAALFLYEDAQGDLQSTLEDWWIKIDDRSHEALSRHTLFMRNIARLAASGFEKVFGKKLFSPKSICVSATYSLASICLVGAAFWEYSGIARYGIDSFKLTQRHIIELSEVVVAVIILITVGSLHLFIRKNLWLKLWYVMVFVFDILLVGVYFFTIYLDLSWPFLTIISNLLAFYGAMALGVLSDTAFIAINRKILIWSSGMESFIKIAGSILANCAMAFLLIIIPSLLIRGSQLRVDEPFTLALWWAAMSNFLIAISALVFVILALVMLLHRIFWPFINKPLYALQRIGIARRSKLFATLGIVLIGVATGIVPGWLKEILNHLIPV